MSPLPPAPSSRSAVPGASMLTSQPSGGRAFSATRRVSIDDCSPTGRMELDAIARFLQDVGNDDTDDAGFGELGLAWVARRALINVVSFPSTRSLVELTTWASGTGRRWAERRTSMHGSDGSQVDAAAIWIHLDPKSGKPAPWGEEFAATYLPTTAGRTVDARLRLRKAPQVEERTHTASWSFRKTDSDAYGHVNNAAYLAVAEEFLDVTEPCSLEIEWRSPTRAGSPLLVKTSIEESPNGSASWLWLLDDETHETHAVFRQSALHPVGEDPSTG